MSSSADRWKALDAASYDHMTEPYDEFSHRLALPFATRLVSLAGLRDGERMLDVGTGTGMIPFVAAFATPPSSTILGIDISTGMIDKARRRASELAIPRSRLSFRQMDAESLSLPDREFDVVTSAFALGHIPNPSRAVGEMERVLRPGGRVLVAIGSRPPLFSVDTVTHAAAEIGRRIQAFRGLRLNADLLDRVIDRHLPDRQDDPKGAPLATQLNRTASIASLLKSAGFQDIRRSWRNYQHEVSSAEEFWEIQRTINTRPRKRLLDADPKVVDAVHDDFTERCERTLRSGGRLVYAVSAVFFTACKRAMASLFIATSVLA